MTILKYWRKRVAHRRFGSNKNIDVAEIEKIGIKFVVADLEDLPFGDKQFDVAYKRLTKMLRRYWFGHYKNIETCFVWKDRFDYLIVHKDGSFKSSVF